MTPKASSDAANGVSGAHRAQEPQPAEHGEDRPRTALVLGGGGVTGIGWEIGVLHGLATSGTDLTAADVVIGTSAGSVVGAQITSATPLAELYAEQTSPADAEIGAEFPMSTMGRFAMNLLLPGSPTERRARLGRAALKAHPGSAEERLQVIGSRLGTLDWPADRDLRITAVKVADGQSVVFTRDSGVDLVHAIAASCAVPLIWPPVEIDGERYIDGGVRSSANADLATGAEVIVVLAPLPAALSKYHALPQQLARSGARWTAVVTPDQAALKAIGRNVLDPTRRVGATLSGFRQGRALAAKMAERWPVSAAHK